MTENKRYLTCTCGYVSCAASWVPNFTTTLFSHTKYEYHGIFSLFRFATEYVEFALCLTTDEDKIGVTRTIMRFSIISELNNRE